MGEYPKSLRLYHRLKAYGLQHHFEMFTSAGVCHIDHLRRMTIEDYPLVGICSTEESARLSQLIRIVNLERVPAYGDSDDEDYTDEGHHKLSASSGIGNHRLRDRNHQCHRHTGGSNSKTDTESSSAYSSYIGLSSNGASSTEPKSKSKPVTTQTLGSKLVRQRDRNGISRKQRLHAKINGRMDNKCTTMKIPIYESKRTVSYNYGLPQSSFPSHQKKQPAGQRIVVCVRKRPLTLAECKRGEEDVVTALNEQCVNVNESKEAVDLSQYILQHKFYFDQVFGEESSNEEVYRRTAYPLVQHMLNGGSATCFAYGQTGAGKTYTMLGSSPERPGLYMLAVQDIFAHISTTPMHSPLLVYVSFFEIYCGQLYDLLNHRKRLYAREDRHKVVHIAGLRDVRVESISSVLKVISHGMAARTQGISGVNPLSSRSHAMLQIQLKQPNQQMVGRMWFVDLAGSERASETKETDRRNRLEGAEINQSLLSLKECIRSLDQKQSHTPFRQSKLTQVLKDSFVGDSRTCMIANISPGHLATDHTLNTLRYADRVKELKGNNAQEGRKIYTVPPSSKQNLSSSRSSVATEGNGLLKRPKLGMQTKSYGPIGSSASLDPEDPVFCSTLKSSVGERDTCASARQGKGLGQFTRVRELQRKCEKSEKRAGLRELGAKYGRTDNAKGANHGKDKRTGTVLGQAKSQNPYMCMVEKNSVFQDRETENQWCTLTQEDGEVWTGQREHVEKSKGTVDKDKILRQRYLQEVNARDKERKRHLRQYHLQLQQCSPLSASSSHISLSEQASPSSSSTPQLCSNISASDLMCTDLEKELHAHRARVHLWTDGNDEALSYHPSGEVGLSPRCQKKEVEVGAGDLDVSNKDGMAAADDTEAQYVHGRCKRLNLTSLKTANQEQMKLREGDWKSAGMERRGKWRWAWVAPSVADRTDIATELGQDDADSLGYNSDSLEGEEETGASAKVSDHLPAMSACCTSEPLSVSLLQMNEKADRSLLCQEKRSSYSLYSLENEKGEMKDDKCPSFLNLQAKTHFPATSNTMTLAEHLEKRKNKSSLTYEHYRIGMTKPGFLQDDKNICKPQATAVALTLENKTTASHSAALCSETTMSCRSTGSPRSPHQMPADAKQILKPRSESVPCLITTSKQHQSAHSKHSSQSNLSLPLNSAAKSNIEEGVHTVPMIHLSTQEDLFHAQRQVVQAHWHQAKYVETLFQEEEMLLYHQPNMAFGEYIHRLLEIMEKKAHSVNSMIAQVQTYLMTSHSNQSHTDDQLTLI